MKVNLGHRTLAPVLLLTTSQCSYFIALRHRTSPSLTLQFYFSPFTVERFVASRHISLATMRHYSDTKVELFTTSQCTTFNAINQLTLHPAVNLKCKETVSFCEILVGCIESSAHPVADHQAADSWSSEESVAAALWE